METLRDGLADLGEGPFADLLESDEAYLVVMDLPGATPDSTSIEYDRGHIHVEARRAKDVPPEFQFEREDRPIFLDAELPVPPDAAGTEASASIDRGVLELRLPKTGSVGREIAIE